VAIRSVHVRLFACASLVLATAAAAAVFAPAGTARSSNPGDGCLVVAKGFGRVTVTLTRGVVFGRFQSGTLKYNDQGLDPVLPRVPGTTPTKTSEHTWTYGPAEGARFRASGPTKLIVYAQFIDLSVAGKGTATISNAGLDAVPSVLNPPYNAYSVDASSFCEDNFQKMPQTPVKVQISTPIAG